MQTARSVAGGGTANWEEGDWHEAKAFLSLENDKVPPMWQVKRKSSVACSTHILQVQRIEAKVSGHVTPRRMMICNVLAFRSSPKRSAKSMTTGFLIDELVILYNEHFGFGEYDERRLVMSTAPRANSSTLSWAAAHKVKSLKRPRGG
jgi:hypothetical protein